LKYLNINKDKSKKLTRWFLELLEWNPIIKHVPGRLNHLPDLLSRAPVSPLDGEVSHMEYSPDYVYTPFVASLIGMAAELTLQQLKQCQETDQEIQKLIELLRDGNCRSTAYVLKNGILHRYVRPINTLAHKKFINRTQPAGTVGNTESNEININQNCNSQDNYPDHQPERDVICRKPVHQPERDVNSQDISVHQPQRDVNEVNVQNDHYPQRDVIKNQLLQPKKVNPIVKEFKQKIIQAIQYPERDLNQHKKVSPQRKITFKEFMDELPKDMRQDCCLEPKRRRKVAAAVQNVNSLNAHHNSINLISSEFILVPVIPKSLVPELIKAFHDDPKSAHMGIRKTKNRIKERAFWEDYSRI
jgi:hypothetical protein